MSLDNSQLLFSGDTGISDPYKISRSLRLRAGGLSSRYLSRTFSSTPTNNSVWTWSCWIKRGSLASIQRIFSGSTSRLYFESDDTLNFINTGTSAIITTTAAFRDPSSWYHIVLNRSGTSGAGTFTLWVNNVQIGSANVTANGFINSPSANHLIGTTSSDAADYYITECHFVDGEALTPSSFGTANADTGVWRPKSYTGTYGTNGFFLNFSDNSALTTSSNVGLGKDNSGNDNYWVTNNISLTAGTTYDSMRDVPTLTNNFSGNYCVLNPLRAGSTATISDVNLKFECNSGQQVTGSIFVKTGKWYWETIFSNRASTAYTGICNVTSVSYQDVVILYVGSGQQNINGTLTSYGSSFANSDVIGHALDMDNGTITFYKNNVSQGSINLSSAGITEATASIAGGVAASGAVGTVNFGQQPFVYTAPSGFLPINTYNLPAPTIPKGNEYMDATTYTGNGSTQTITNAAEFQPDFVWLKFRSASGSNYLFDIIRGALAELNSDNTQAEASLANSLTSFNSNGFSLGASSGGNASGTTYVGWQWQAGVGTTSSNANGSITSTVSVNADAGFSIVSYTGNTTSGATIGHGLGVAPKMLIVKNRTSTTDDWQVYHTSLPDASYRLRLNTNAIATSQPAAWNSTAPTSTVFTVGNATSVNGSTTMIAYCWSEVDGFSKFGYYIGNGDVNGAFTYTGFRPKFILIKRTTNTATSWFIIDSTRNTLNITNLGLNTDTANAEFTGSTTTIPFYDMLSNGFKVRGTSSSMNTLGDTYIYAAFAENPFKYSNAR